MSTRTALVAVVVVAVLGLVVVVQGMDSHLPGNHIGYEPDQPIPFSHQIHAGELQIPCLYCHGGAERSRHAGIPSASLCMTCHQFVDAPKAERDHEETLAKAQGRDPAKVLDAPGARSIRRIYEALGLDDTGQKPDPERTPKPVEWVRVHNLPDYAYFDHRSHVTAGVLCATCHGPVEGMTRVRQFADLTMGWCVNCHRQANAAGTLTNGRKAAASTDCTACHY